MSDALTKAIFGNVVEPAPSTSVNTSDTIPHPNNVVQHANQPPIIQQPVTEEGDINFDLGFGYELSNSQLSILDVQSLSQTVDPGNNVL